MAIAQSTVQYVENERTIVEEAFRRGASVRLLIAWLFWRRSKVPPSQIDSSKAREIRSALYRLIEPQLLAYRSRITAEFSSLRIAFKDPSKGHTDLEHYHLMRPLYYVGGYDDPAKAIFQRIRQYYFLGKDVPGGVHEAFIRVLDRVSGILRATSPDLPARVAAAIGKQDGGFVPRFIAGSTTLSNHAYGLAIDIDPPSNPHIKNPPKPKKPIIPVLNEVVSTRTGIRFDFGKTYAEGKEWSRFLNEDQKIMVTHMSASAASQAVQEWLQQNLPTYEDCTARIAAGAKAPAGSPARQQADEARQTIDEDRDLQLIQAIRGDGSEDYPSIETLRGWAKTGIQTIPLELVMAIKQAMRQSGYPKGAGQGGWGQDYEHSKDAMHFEIEARQAIPPDTKPRTLSELFPAEIQPLCNQALFSPELDKTWPEVGLAGLP
jgi:hypothetical protein